MPSARFPRSRNSTLGQGHQRAAHSFARGFGGTSPRKCCDPVYEWASGRETATARPAAFCLCGLVCCLCCRHAALQRQSAQHRRLLAQYGVSEARLANADEMGSMLEEGGGDEAGSANGGIVLQAVVQRVEKARP